MHVRWISVLLASAFLAVGSPSIAHAAPPPFDYQKGLVGSFTDALGRPVLLRRGYYEGGRGFGWDKILHRHGITNPNLIEMIVKNPDGGEAQGTARVYRGVAQRFNCDITSRCTEVERIPLKAVVEFREDSNLGAGQKGIITAYCDYGPVECPGWVNRVVNVAPA